MDRRVALAIGLMLVVALLPSLLFPPERPDPNVASEVADSVAPPVVAAVGDSAVARSNEPAATVEGQPPVPVAPAGDPPQFVVVESELYRYVFSSRGARLVSATLKSYQSFAPNDSGLVQLIPDDSQFLAYSLLLGNDTLSLGDWDFNASDSLVVVGQQAEELTWVARRGAVTVELRQRFHADDYQFDVDGRFTGTSATAGLVLVSLGPRFRLVEADSVWDFRNRAVVTKARSTERTSLNSVDPFERVALSGPFEWVAFKSRYFAAVVLAIQEGAPQIGGALVTGGVRTGKHATDADVVVSLPAPAGQFGHGVYLGPQEFQRLAAIGHGLEDLNPYGWIFRPIIRPFAGLIVRVLLWMHETLNLSYGWVLVLFGVAVRIVLWPLNQKAMKSSVAMQAIQPEIKAVQERYKGDPQRLQQEMMKLYKEHQVNPLGGCLPMLLPMPVLFALFFVFRETIEFRGVPFLWLPDLSRADPLYIIPVLMGLSMFVMSKVGQRGIPPNPQAKMLLYFMPVMLTVLFLRFSAGLNLYYAVSNIASIPQQWLISRERLRRVGAATSPERTKVSTRDRQPARTSRKSSRKKRAGRKR